MIGSGLKKLAKENDMKVDKGVAYGSLRGYAATLSEGAGYKLIHLTTIFRDPQAQFQLETAINGRDMMKEFRVEKVLFTEKSISILFYDNPGTMKKIYAFMDWFFPLLDTYEATKANICVECGEKIVSGQWKLIEGAAYHFHQACADSVVKQLDLEADVRKAEDTGSYGSGLVGALLGAALGAVLWALVLFLGYVASIVGFAIGWLAEKGYHLFHGKNGKGKIAILIVAVIFGVLLGTLLGDTISLVSMIHSGELIGFTYGDIPWLFVFLLSDAEYLMSVLGNMGIGLLFAGLGIFSLLRRANKEVSDVKVQDLK